MCLVPCCICSIGQCKKAKYLGLHSRQTSTELVLCALVYLECKEEYLKHTTSSQVQIATGGSHSYKQNLAFSSNVLIVSFRIIYACFLYYFGVLLSLVNNFTSSFIRAHVSRKFFVYTGWLLSGGTSNLSGIIHLKLLMGPLIVSTFNRIIFCLWWFPSAEEHFTPMSLGLCTSDIFWS